MFNEYHATIVNIGVEYGRSISLFAKAAPFASVYGVELSPRPEYAVNMAAAGLTPTVLIGDSAEIGMQWERAIDLCFIDACHWYNCVVKDIRAWCPHVKVGGVVLFHDAAPHTNPAPHEQHIEVERAINEWQAQDGNKWRELNSVDTIRGFERVK